MPDSELIEWVGDLPTECEVCHRPLSGSFYDAKTKKGPWGILCLECVRTEGVGLGQGHGQKFEYHPALDSWIMTAGGAGHQPV